MSALMEMRPPPVHANKRQHWVQYSGGATDVWTWEPGKDHWDRTSLIQSNPSDAYDAGYRYLGPAEWTGGAISMDWSDPATEGGSRTVFWSSAEDIDTWIRPPNARGEWMPEPDRLSLVERARLVEIAHASTVPEIMMAALDVLKAAAIVSAMELYPQVLVDDEPAPLTSAEDAPHA